MPLQSEGELLAKIEMLLESRLARKKRIHVRLSPSVWGEGRKVIMDQSRESKSQREGWR